MSTISEIDIRDWEKVDFKALRECLDSVDDCTRMGPCHPFGAINYLFDSLTYLEGLRDKQLREATKHVPAIFKKGEE